MGVYNHIEKQRICGIEFAQSEREIEEKEKRLASGFAGKEILYYVYHKSIWYLSKDHMPWQAAVLEGIYMPPTYSSSIFVILSRIMRILSGLRRFSQKGNDFQIEQKFIE